MSDDTQAAGAGLSDEEFAERVAGQTSSDLEAEPIFERESAGTTTDKEAADISADDLQE